MSLIVEPASDAAGNFLNDTWNVVNAANAVVVLVAVEVVGVHTYDPDTDQFLSLPLEAVDADQLSGVTLRFEDAEFQTQMTDRQSWSGVVLQPGSTLRAMVLSNRELRLTFRSIEPSAADETVIVRGNI